MQVFINTLLFRRILDCTHEHCKRKITCIEDWPFISLHWSIREEVLVLEITNCLHL
jgi:hypothetical protein